MADIDKALPNTNKVEIERPELEVDLIDQGTPSDMPFEVTQLEASQLFGLTPVTWSRWETGRSHPSGYGLVVLDLLHGSLQHLSPMSIRENLHHCRGEPTNVMRALVQMEKLPIE